MFSFMNYNRILMITILTFTSSFYKMRTKSQRIWYVYKCYKIYKDKIEFRKKNMADSTKNTERRKPSFPKD